MTVRVLLVTQYFYPESFKSNDIAFELVKRGWQVEALVGIPNYPAGRYFNGYGVFSKRVEIINGVKVYRAFQFARGTRHSGRRLMLNYLSYALCASLWALWFAVFKRRFDAIIIHETSPITQAFPAIILGKLKHMPVYTWVLDIWPDAMRSGGGVKNNKAIAAVDAFVQWVYRHSEKILISSKDFKPLVNRRADYSNKIIYFPNWCDDMLKMERPAVPLLPEGFKVMMAGNLGSAQDIGNVMQAVLLLKEYKEIKWIFVGDGSERNYIERFAERHQLQGTVVTTGKRPFNEMPSYYAQADVMLLTLRADFPHLRAVVPARLQSYMSFGRPIIGMADGGSVRIINDSKCGICVKAGDYKGLADTILKLCSQVEDLQKMGHNARQYYECFFTKTISINNLEKIIGQ